MLWLMITATLTFLAGITMFFINYGKLYSLGTAQGDYLFAGMLLGTGAYLHGAFVQRKNILNLQKIGAEVAAQGAPPTPEQGAAMGMLAGKIERNGVILAYLIGITVVVMATFQYFTF